MKYALFISENALLNVINQMDGYHYLDSLITWIRSVFN